jgi:hypothetical protein
MDTVTNSLCTLVNPCVHVGSILRLHFFFRRDMYFNSLLRVTTSRHLIGVLVGFDNVT